MSLKPFDYTAPAMQQKTPNSEDCKNVTLVHIYTSPASALILWHEEEHECLWFRNGGIGFPSHPKLGWWSGQCWSWGTLFPLKERKSSHIPTESVNTRIWSNMRYSSSLLPWTLCPGWVCPVRNAWWSVQAEWRRILDPQRHNWPGNK